MSETTKATAKKPEAKRENAVSQIRQAKPTRSLNSPVDRILFLQRTVGNQAVQRMMKSGALQAKLNIGQPGDRYEQEADLIAEQAMRMPEPQVQRQIPQAEEGMLVQMKEKNTRTSEVIPGMRGHVQTVSGSGQPLPEDTRTFFKSRFSYDFSQVRVHTDSRAARAARALGAMAFTVGHRIVFAKGKYRPDTLAGRRLLAHELAHVVQTENTSKEPTIVMPSGIQGERGVDRITPNVSLRQINLIVSKAPKAVRKLRAPELSKYLQKLEALAVELKDSRYTEKILRRIFESLHGLDLRDPDNMGPVGKTIYDAFIAVGRNDVYNEFMSQLDRIYYPRKRLPTEDQHGPYGTYGPGIALPIAVPPIAAIMGIATGGIIVGSISIGGLVSAGPVVAKLIYDGTMSTWAWILTKPIAATEITGFVAGTVFSIIDAGGFKSFFKACSDPATAVSMGFEIIILRMNVKGSRVNLKAKVRNVTPGGAELEVLDTTTTPSTSKQSTSEKSPKQQRTKQKGVDRTKPSGLELDHGSRTEQKVPFGEIEPRVDITKPSGLELDHGSRTEQKVPFGEIEPRVDITKPSGLKLAKTQKSRERVKKMKPKKSAFGEPSSQKAGTEHRKGEYYNLFNIAEIEHNLHIDYDPIAGRPRKVTFYFDKEVLSGSIQSSRSFKPDISIEGAQSSTQAYKGSGYHKGHLGPREAFKGSPEAEIAVDQMPNIVPMTPTFNRVKWREAEVRTRGHADKYGSVKVEIEPIYDKVPPKLSDGTPIPKEIRRRVTKLDGTVIEDAAYPNL